MLSPELIKKIKRIHIKTGRIVDTMMAGQYQSAFRGTGIEFEEVREYSPGDEIKSIDWNVSARMGRPYIKLYREERELVIMLLVDMSASGGFGTTSSLKRETAAELASVLAFNAIRNNDKIGLILFTDRVERYIPPQKGSSHVWRVIREILAFEPEHPGTDIGEAAGFLGRVARKKTVAFLISDFLTEGYEHPAKVVAGQHDLIGVVVSDPGDFKLPAGGIMELQDMETGECLFVDASDAWTRSEYGRLKRKEYERSLERLEAMGIDRIEVNTEGSLVEPLQRFFRYREKRLRS